MKNLLILLLVFLSFQILARRNDVRKKSNLSNNTETLVPSGFNSTVANVWTELTNYGFIGDDAFYGFSDPSFEWPGGSGNHHLYMGSIWIAGKDPSNVIHCTAPDEEEITLTTDPADTVKLFHPGDPYFQIRPNVHPSLADSQVSAEDTYAEYTDLDPGRHNPGESPLGIKIIERTYKWSTSYNYDFIIFDYQLINIGLDNDGDYSTGEISQTLTEVYFGIRMDADISHLAGGEYWYDDMVDYDSLYNISYMYDGDDPDRPGNDIGEFGVSNGHIFASLLNASGGSPFINYSDPVSHTWWEINDDPSGDHLKFDFMSMPGYRQKTVAPYDYRYLQNAGPFDMQPNDTVNVVWVCGLGEGLNAARYSVIRSKEIYDNQYQIPQNPQPYPPFEVGLRNVYPDSYLYWEKTPEPDVASFNVYANSSLLDNISSDSTQYVLPSSLTIGTSYQFYVTTVWNNGAESIFSDTVDFIYGIPSLVTGIHGFPQDSSVNISWNANPEINITGYNIYRNSQFIINVTNTTYSDSGLTNGEHYSYQISAVNSHGLESERSAEIIVTPTDRTGTGILLVDDHGQNNPLIKGFFESFVVFGYNYTYWNISQQGRPSLSELENYSSVLWFCGDDSSNNDLYELTQVTNELRNYLDNGGNLWISGAVALPLMTNDILPSTGDFVYDYLKIINWTNENSEFYTALGINFNLPDLLLDIEKAGESLNYVSMVNDPDSSLVYETNTIYNFGNIGYNWPGPYQDKPCAVFYSGGAYNTVLNNFPIYYMGGNGIRQMSEYILTMIFGESFNTNPVPAPPYGLQISNWSETTIDLIWETNDDPDIIGYNIYTAAADSGPYNKLNNNPLDSTNFTLDNLIPGNTYFIKLSSVDNFLREGLLSDYVSEIVGRPHPVNNFYWTALDSNGIATIQWDVQDEPDIQNYNVYIDNSHTYTTTDTIFQYSTNNLNHTVWVTAVDSMNLESDPSKSISILNIPASRQLLVVNGIHGSAYFGQMQDYYTAGACIGNHQAHVWDLFDYPDIDYSSLNSNFVYQYLSHGSIPDSIMFKYHKVIWIGNVSFGDFEHYDVDQIIRYLAQRGNVILATRRGEEFFNEYLINYSGIIEFSDLTTLSSPINALDSNLVDMGAGTGTFSLSYTNLVQVDTSLVNVKPIFSYNIVPNSWIAGFRVNKPNSGEFIYIAGRPYSYDLNASFLNYDYIIGNWLGGILNDIDEKKPVIPKKIELFQNYPNPFNPVTTIKFGLPKKSNITLTIYNILGQKVKQFKRNYNAGYHEILWNGLNQYNKQVASGVYIYKFEADKFTKTKKCIFMK